jgi:phage shock protein A
VTAMPDEPARGLGVSGARLDVLVDRACRGALTPGEARALRTAVTELRGQLVMADHELTNQRELFEIAYEQQTADLERARRVAVALENRLTAVEDERQEMGRAVAWPEP